MINDYYWFSMFFVLIMLPDAINSFLIYSFFLGIDLVRNEPIWQFSRIKDSFAELLLL